MRQQEFPSLILIPACMQGRTPNSLTEGLRLRVGSYECMFALLACCIETNGLTVTVPKFGTTKADNTKVTSITLGISEVEG